MPIDWLALGAAFLAGLVGSVHCVAMCGGIATGFAGRGDTAASAWAIALSANLGRISGYGLAGVLVGAFGHGLVALLRIEHLMFALRALAGVVLIITALRMLGLKPNFNPLGQAGELIWAGLRPLQKRLLPANTFGRRFALGMLWGWLPCGLSATLLAAAWLQANALGSGLLMVAFGLGTLPTLLPLTWSGARWLIGLRQRRMAGVLMLIAGLLTLCAPWLMRIPALHGILATLGCLPSA